MERIPHYSKEAGAEPCRVAKTFGRAAGAHRCTGIATADKPMQLRIGQFEKPLRLAVGVVLKAFRTKDNVLIRDGDRRIRASHPIAYGRRLKLCLRECSEASIGLFLQKFRPPQEAFVMRRHGVLDFCVNTGGAPQRFKGLVLHRRLL
jgi:hypothetical protein